MRLATWNVNSVRAREQALSDWLAAAGPDVVCLQEIKVQEAEFPWAAIEAAGYRAAVVGQKAYNGVAVISRSAIEVLGDGLHDGVDDPQARLCDVRTAGMRVVSVYVPNGGEPASDKYAYKLTWLERLHAWLRRCCDPGEPLCIGGDWNIAPDDLDVRFPAAWRDTVLCTPEVRQKWRSLCDWGLVDAVRARFPEDRLFSWWDYRGQGFERNDGVRIDHWLVTAPVAARVSSAGADRALRSGDKPSDHVPVWIEVQP